METKQRLSKYREASGISQERAAEELNVSRQTISRWENGVSTPSAENLMKLSKLYNVSLDVLVNGLEESVSEPEQRGTEAPSEDIPAEEYPAEKPSVKKPPKHTRIKALVLAGLALILWTAAVIAGVLYFQRRNEPPVLNDEMKVEVIDPSTALYMPFIPFE